MTMHEQNCVMNPAPRPLSLKEQKLLRIQEAIERFEEATIEYAFRGSYDVSRRHNCVTEHENAKSNLLSVIRKEL